MNENTQTVAVKSDSIGIQTDSGIESAGSDNEGKITIHQFESSDLSEKVFSAWEHAAYLMLHK